MKKKLVGDRRSDRTKKLVEELRRAVKASTNDDSDLPRFIPLKKGQVVATFIKRHKKEKN